MSTTDNQTMFWKECDRRIPAGSARLRRDVPSPDISIFQEFLNLLGV